LRFSQKGQDGSVPKLFSGFRRKYLFITTCIEKHCTGSLLFQQSYYLPIYQK